MIRIPEDDEPEPTFLDAILWQMKQEGRATRRVLASVVVSMVRDEIADMLAYEGYKEAAERVIEHLDEFPDL